MFKNILLVTSLLMPLGASAMMGALPSGPGLDAVGSLKSFDSENAHCTATLIAPNWIVTAQHCRFYETDEGGGEYLPGEIEFLVGEDSRRPSQKRKIKRWVHGGSSPLLTTGLYGSNEIDMLFAELESPIKNVSPIPMSAVPSFSTAVGVRFELVGFGVTDVARLESKRQKGPQVVTGTRGNPFKQLFGSEAGFKTYLKNAHPGEEEALDRHFANGEISSGFQVHAWDARGRESGRFTSRPRGGWASSCNGDSGGPLLRYANKKVTVVGTVSMGFNGATEACVRLGTRFSIIDPQTRALLIRNRVPLI